MIQGTRAGIGKSVVTTGLASMLRQQGLVVQVFKPQVMSRKRYHLRDGGVLPPTLACALEGAGQQPTKHHCPIFLEPESTSPPFVDHFATNARYRVHVLGRYVGTSTFAEYAETCSQYADLVVRAIEDLAERSDLLLIEGSGCPTELTASGDALANAFAANAADARIILMADLFQGGAFASVVGVHRLMSDEQRNRVEWLLFNKAPQPADIGHVEASLARVEEMTGVPVLAVLPAMPGVSRSVDFPAVVDDQRRLWSPTLDGFVAHLQAHLPLARLAAGLRPV